MQFKMNKRLYTLYLLQSPGLGSYSAPSLLSDSAPLKLFIVWGGFDCHTKPAGFGVETASDLTSHSQCNIQELHQPSQHKLLLCPTAGTVQAESVI